MAKLSYSYLPFDSFDPITNEKVGEIFRPFVSIRLQQGHQQLSIPVDALIDSGADRNLFPLEIGTLFLKMNFRKVKPKIIIGIGNSEFKAYPAKFNI